MSDTKTKTVVIIGSGYWGKGDTVEQAKRRFRDHGGQLRYGYDIYTFDATTEFKGVDEVGRYHYVGNAPTIEVVGPRSVGVA